MNASVFGWMLSKLATYTSSKKFWCFRRGIRNLKFAASLAYIFSTTQDDRLP